MDTNKTAYVRYDDKFIYIYFYYHSGCNWALKDNTRSWEWLPDSKEWKFDITEKDIALEIVKKYFNIQETGQPQKSPEIW